jgi:hypothetical protein
VPGSLARRWGTSTLAFRPVGVVPTVYFLLVVVRPLSGFWFLVWVLGFWFVVLGFGFGFWVLGFWVLVFGFGFWFWVLARALRRRGMVRGGFHAGPFFTSVGFCLLFHLIVALYRFLFVTADYVDTSRWR